MEAVLWPAILFCLLIYTTTVRQKPQPLRRCGATKNAHIAQKDLLSSTVAESFFTCRNDQTRVSANVIADVDELTRRKIGICRVSSERGLPAFMLFCKADNRRR